MITILFQLFGEGRKNCKRLLLEAVKYYFADFVRKGGTPPPLGAKKELGTWS